MAVANDSLEDYGDLSIPEPKFSPSFSHASREKEDSKNVKQDLDTAFSNPENICTNSDSKKMKRLSSSDTSDSLSSPNRAPTFISKRRRRNYRSRVVDSSSDEEMNEQKDSVNSKVSKDRHESESSNHSNDNDQVPQIVSDINSSERDIADCAGVSVNHVPATSSVCEDHPDSSPVPHETEDPPFIGPRLPEDSNTDGISPPDTERRSESQSTERRRRRFFFVNSNSDDSLDSDDDEVNDEDRQRAQRREQQALKRKKIAEALKKQVNLIKEKQRPRDKWNFVNEVWNRQYGSSASKQASVLFSNRYYDSLSVALRLERHKSLDYHTGCVNALNFDPTGQYLASGSDDILIVVWDWCKPRKFTHFDSGHKNNVFQTKFLPLSGSTHIASCARDGQIRLAEYSNLGEWKTTRRLAKHTRSAHKLTTKNDSPYEILSAGEDGVIFNIDIRTDRPEKIVHVKDRSGNRVPLYSIHGHPLNDQQFCISGQDEYVRVYDTRILSPFGPPAIKYCPSNFVEKKPRPSITCAVYSNNGDAILASYNDEDCFLFDTALSEGAEPIHQYSGHRTGSTVKGVNFFGPSSRVIVSGSDCGNIFFWDRETEAIINCLKGDETGVVNVLEPHPSFPILATSGLDTDVKIWTPTSHKDMVPNDDLWQTVQSNLKQRQSDGDDDTFSLNSHMLMMFFQEVSGRYSWRSIRNRASQDTASPQAGAEPSLERLNDDPFYSDNNSSSDANDSDDSDSGRGMQCATH